MRLKMIKWTNVLKKETRDAINIFLANGGTFEIANYATYNTKKYNVLCQAIPGKVNCLENPLILDDVSNKFNQRLNKKIFSCIDLDVYKKSNLLILTGDFNVNVSIGNKAVAVNINYPITLSSNAINITRSEFTRTINVPLGELIKGANDVLRSESTVGGFNPVIYGLISLNKYEIEIKTFYPNKFYFIGLTNSPYKLKFAVTGNDRFA